MTTHPTDLDTLLKEERAKNERLERHRDMLKQLLDDANAAHFDATMRADAAESRLASLTGQVEDAAREKVVAWMIQHSIATGHGDTLDDLLGELSAYVRKMQADRAPSPTSHRLLADAVVSRDERIASLTGQVEDMRERAAKVAEEIEDRYAREWRAGHKSDSHMEGMSDGAGEVAAAIRSLHVLPGTGDGGGDDDLPDPSEVRGILKPRPPVEPEEDRT